MVHKNFCDKCEIEIKNFANYSLRYEDGPFRTSKYYDLCSDCGEKVLNYIKEQM